MGELQHEAFHFTFNGFLKVRFPQSGTFQRQAGHYEREVLNSQGSSCEPGFPIWLWYRSYRISSRALIFAGSTRGNPPRRVAPCG